jgi:preprotein translocase subunit SecA
MANILSALFSKNESAQFVKKAQSVVDLSNTREASLTNISKEDLQAALGKVRESSKGIVSTNEEYAEVFALTREAARRTLGERHYDVQLIGGYALSQGKIAEMRTGEGKTLVATLGVVARALAGKGVHVVTVNDYLARRDGAWMGQVYEYLGLTLGVVTNSGSYVYDASHTKEKNDEQRDEEGSFRVFYEYLRPATKKEAYDADITYVTNNELGFDYLRDNTTYNASQIVHRGYHYAIIDEIDSILIDEARTPLIISGPAPQGVYKYDTFAQMVQLFVVGEDYTIDEKQRAIQLTSSGIQKAEVALGIENLYTEGGVKLAHQLENAVKAKALFHKDKEYVVKDGEIIIVDEFTGRLQPGRRWSDGLHQAIEAKENLEPKAETRTYASVTFQNFFRMYTSLAGMTGTALSSEEEFYSVYKLEVVVIPTHRKIQRVDHHDHIFQSLHGKYTALAQTVKEYHEKGQPVLIGTVSIEDNEVISEYLRNAGIPHEVLNAKNHEREGEIIAQAGRKGHVTVATNLAGRGVDIKLGGAPFDKDAHEEIVSLGGLAVLGTERHEARRIDNQLRGRSGRQGDKGETRFFVSLDDKLMRVFAADSLKKVMGSFKVPEDQPLTSGLISKALETAQKRIEGYNFDSRKNVLQYDDVMNTQRLALYARRQKLLSGTNEDIASMISDILLGNEEGEAVLNRKCAEYGKEVFLSLLRHFMLQVTDSLWLEHLENMEYIRRSVGLRAYGQRDPLIEYQKEGLRAFKNLEETIKRTITDALPRLHIQDASALAQQEQKKTREVEQAIKAQGENAALPQVSEKVYDRNELVTIEKEGQTQTLKYKKAEPLLQEGWVISSK